MIKAHYKLHFIGIGGIGMSGIAEVFLSQGHKVTGSDAAASEITERLVRLGAEVFIGHKAEQIKDVDVVVTSSAVHQNNPEVVEARERGIPVIPRAEMLAEIMRGKVGVAVAGTHGKTTTTSMIAQILMKAGLDPTVVVGGKVEAIGSNAKVGSGNVVVAEADESDGSFHFLPATFSVVTNIDTDHMEYFKTVENLRDTFVRFAKKTPFYGCTWLCGDNSGVREILPQLTKPFQTYGFEEDNNLIAKKIEIKGKNIQKFEVWHRLRRNQDHQFLGSIELSVLGQHNILNALAAIGIALSLGVNFFAAKEALAQFRHVRRRFDERFYSAEKNIRIIDDYGHHPTEIRAVLATAKQAAKQWGSKRIITVFQPHRYSRTQLCWKDFLDCFAECIHEPDQLIMLPIYSAGEDPIEGVSSAALVDLMKGNPKPILAQDLSHAAEAVLKMIQKDDLVITMGAGSITQLPDALKKSL